MRPLPRTLVLLLLLGVLHWASGWSHPPPPVRSSYLRRTSFSSSTPHMVAVDEDGGGGLPVSETDAAKLLTGTKLHLMLHVPSGCENFPDGEEQSLLRASGVSAIVVDREHGHGAMPSTCLPIVQCDTTDELTVDGRRWIWLSGRRREDVLERAVALRGRQRAAGYIASLPSGGAASESALRRSR